VEVDYLRTGFDMTLKKRCADRLVVWHMYNRPLVVEEEFGG